jgi:hypothetical protein
MLTYRGDDRDEQRLRSLAQLNARSATTRTPTAQPLRPTASAG